MYPAHHELESIIAFVVVVVVVVVITIIVIIRIAGFVMVSIVYRTSLTSIFSFRTLLAGVLL